MTVCRYMRMCLVAVTLLAAAGMAACGGKMSETVNTAQEKISTALRSQGIYERNNLPEDNPPTPDQINGWFDIVGGAYRHIVNEDRDNREPRYEIERGDSIAFMFDGRIFSGSSFGNMQTFYTNDEARIKTIVTNNPDFDTKYWPTTPLRIKVGDDPAILKSLQRALISCRAGDGDPSNDDEPNGIASDEVRVYLTPDLAFGDRMVYNVPRNSTIVFQITDIEIIEN